MTVRKAVYCKWLLFLIIISQAFTARAQLTANFSATPLSGCAPLLVNFTDLSTGNPTSWRWDLGNGTISFLKNPAVTYFAPGKYNVKLTVTNANGTHEIVKSEYITVYGVPVVNFNANPLTGCFPLPVQFADQSNPGSGTISKWEWDFGDGNLSSLQNPSHTYLGAGNFNVSQRVTNSFGCVTTITKNQFLQISNGAKSGFTFSIPSSCTVPVTVTFTNTSTGSGSLTYKWDFGDGGTSSGVNPSHTYTSAGTYSVKLITINTTGCTDTFTRVNAITVGKVKANFSLPPVICEGSRAAILNSSTPVPLTVNWYFGDGTTSQTFDPVKTYTSTGTYNIKLVAGFGACDDSVTQTITVFPKPTLAFAADKTSSCKAPLTVNFTSTVTGAVQYIWDFGDGATSSLKDPSHTYTNEGTYNVKLVAVNASGCKDSIVKSAFIKVQTPSVTIDNLPVKDCAPLTHTFKATVNSVDPVVSYLWNFGDGTTSTLATPTHTFPLGNYTISVIVVTASGCSDTATIINGIVAGSKLIPNFSATPRDACAKITINFSDSTLGGTPDRWLWRFGDGTTSTEKNPKHPYQDTGYFDVTLIVWNNGCADSIKLVDYIHISPPIAVFSVDSDCKTPAQRQFTDHSIGADTWHWDFGDGTTSTLPNPPVHTYASPGSYDVKLTVTNLKTGCDHQQTQTVVIAAALADFNISDTSVCRGNSVTFSITGINAGNVDSYLWKFGDGTVSSDSSLVKHVYDKSGKYDVTLIITDKLGCKDSVTKPLRVVSPVALFKSSTPGICLNNAITFTDSSQTDGYPIQKWIWNFGDSVTQTFTSPPFQHLYDSPGVYSVKLTVVDSKGCTDSIVQTSSFTISKPIADFISADTLSCLSQPILFTNKSKGPNLTYRWEFGDGASSTDTDPVHNYAKEGIYTIKLVITDEFGCKDSIVKTNYITIADPVADFLLSDTLSTCPPLVIVYTNLSKNFVKRTWDFGDGTFSSLDNPTHFYTTPGIYNIVLTVTGYNGCTSQKTKQVVVRGPQGSFTYTNILGCNPLTTNFKGATKDDISFIWDFNDGATSSTTDSIISHTYTNPGFYVPKMILVDKAGCQVPIVGADTIKVFGVKADFTSSTTTLCDSGYVSFRDTSFTNDIITNYLWKFGDGTTSNLQNPVHSYSAAGNYQTSLTVTTQHGCTDTVNSPIPIKIINSPLIDITSINGVCIPATIHFKGEILQPDSSALTWQWDFGNGKTSNQQNPPAQIYFGAGSYTVKAVATNSSGCKDSVTKTIQTFPLPVVQANADSTLCLGQTINLSASGAVSYTWTPSAGLSCTNCPNPIARPDSSTQYIVQGVSIDGCLGWDTVNLAVRLPFKMVVNTGDTLCIGGSTQISATGANSYVWYPSAGLNNATISNPVASPTSTTNYRVIGQDDKGCFKDTGYVPIKVYPIPTVSAGSDKTINVGQTHDLDPTLSPDVTNTVWTPTSGIFRNRFPGITVKPPVTTEYTVEVVNEGGCKARDKVTIFVLCNNANVFIPNTFSPNDDGANDVFYPRGTGVYRIQTFRVFNRWGEVVFEKTNFNANDATAGWDGSYKGKKLNPDVFVYTIDIMCENNTVLTYKGNIALIQ